MGIGCKEKVVLVYNIYEMYVCTEKAAIQEWLKEIEELKTENKRFEELLTKWKDKRIEVLIKENRELRKENKELKKEKWEIKQRFIKLQEAQAKLIRVAENKELRKENKKLKKYYDRDKEELMESCYALKKENDEMKNELAECHWLMDEIDYRKKEAKRLWWKPNIDFMTNLF